MRLRMLMDWLSQYTGGQPKPKAVSVAKTTVSKTVAPKKDEPKADDKLKDDKEDTKKVASANHLMDAYFEGFVKECEARGVDSTELVGILFKSQEKENE